MTATMVRPGDAQTSPALTYQDWSLIGMTKATCLLAECTNVAKTRLMCAKHYYEWLLVNPPAKDRKRPPAERFYEKVGPVRPDGCRLFDGPPTREGHVQFWYQTKMHKAHRWIWEWTYGPVNPDVLICHRCNVPSCVELTHLYAGDAATNVVDRQVSGLWQPNYGERNGHACVSDAHAAEIRKRRAAGEKLRAIGLDYGITESAVWYVVNKRKAPGSWNPPEALL